MIGRASVLAVFCASVYFNVWSKIQTGDNVFLLSVAFVLAFLSADEPWVKYVHTKEEKITVQEKQS